MFRQLLPQETPVLTVFLSGREQEMVDKGKELCEDLIDNVKQQYEEFKNRPPRGYGGGGGGGGHRGGYGDHGPPRGGDSYTPYGGSSYRNEGRPASPRATASASATPPATGTPDYAAQYAQYYGGQDPYAAYGGYAAYVKFTLVPSHASNVS